MLPTMLYHMPQQIREANSAMLLLLLTSVDLPRYTIVTPTGAFAPNETATASARDDMLQLQSHYAIHEIQHTLD